MSKIKVSVIVPVFNVEEYLSTSLDSILNQTLKDIELKIIGLKIIGLIPNLNI